MSPNSCRSKSNTTRVFTRWRNRRHARERIHNAATPTPHAFAAVLTTTVCSTPQHTVDLQSSTLAMSPQVASLDSHLYLIAALKCPYSTNLFIRTQKANAKCAYADAT